MRINGTSSAYLFWILIIFLLFANCTNRNSHTNPPGIISLTDGWQYRTGDSPVDSDGCLIWLNDNRDSSEWISVDKLDDIPGSGYKSLWIRIRLPAKDMLTPALHLNGVRQIVQIYLNGKKIYQFGDFTLNEGDHFKGWRGMLVPLPEDYPDGVLCFRIWSGGPYIGLSQPIWLAPSDTILNRMFIHDADEIIVAPLFVFLGIALFMLLLFFRENRLIWGTALFITSLGVFTGSNSLYLQTVVNAPRVFFLLDFFPLLIAPIGGLYLTEQIIIDRFKLVLRRLWQMHLILLLFSIWPALFLEYVYTDLLYQTCLILTSVSTVLSFILILMSLRKGKRDIHLLFFGLIIFYLFAGVEIGSYYLKTMFLSVGLIHIGALGLVICLTLIVINRYIETNRQKEAAQKKALESEKYKELDRIKSRFFANISHEFRTPLTLILGTARQILDDSQDETVRKKLKLQIKNGGRLLNLVNELLDLSKLDAGRMDLKLEKKDILPLIREAAHHFESYAQQKNITMDWRSERDGVVFCFDHNKMEKVLINLISNALKFTPEGGRIAIAVSVKEAVEIRISDTGSGINPEHLPHIFDRFYQAQKEYPPDQQGSGIGLALARELVRLHHGEIAVQSEAGKGSVFTVQLPLDGMDLNNNEQEITPTSLLPQEPALSPSKGRELDSGDKIDNGENFHPPSFIPPSRGTKGGVLQSTLPIILIVEDNSDLRTYIREELFDDYQIIEAADGEAGFEQAAQHIPDLVISDVMMPKMDGYQLCEKLKTDERTSHIPMVMLTARSDSRSKMEGLTLGADDYLTKPFEPEELRVRIKNLIDQRRKLRERFSRNMSASIAEFAVMPADERFLKRVLSFVESRLDDPDLSVDWLSSQMALSRSQLHRKIQALTNQTVVEFIRTIRLKHAVQLLDSKAATISEIAYQTGFGNPDYFRRCFKKQFGVSPSAYSFQK